MQQNTIRKMTVDLLVVRFDVGAVLVELCGVSDMLKWLDQRISADQLWHRWLGLRGAE
jgi:hypothetical protein